MTEETQGEAAGEEVKAEKPVSKKKAAKKKVAAASEFVVFRSRHPEPREFVIMKVRGQRNAKHPGFCEWHVKAEDAERFSRHPHVARMRVVKVDD